MVNQQRLTSERHAAAERLRAFPARYRVVPDLEGWPLIPGRAGRIEVHDDTTLAVYTDRPRLFAKLWAIRSVRRYQTGDAEMRAVFPPEALAQVAGIIGAKWKRSLSSDQARRIGARTALNGLSASQKPHGR